MCCAVDCLSIFLVYWQQRDNHVFGMLQTFVKLRWTFVLSASWLLIIINFKVLQFVLQILKSSFRPISINKTCYRSNQSIFIKKVVFIQFSFKFLEISSHKMPENQNCNVKNFNNIPSSTSHYYKTVNLPRRFECPGEIFRSFDMFRWNTL